MKNLLAIMVFAITLLSCKEEPKSVLSEKQSLQKENPVLHFKQNLIKSAVDSIFKKEAVPGSIIDQTPKPNNKVKEGRDIYVTIYARNPQQISVPGLVDFSTRQAIALLNSIGFTQIAIEEVPAQYSGLVMSVEYRGKKLMPDEQIPAGSPLKLVVSSGMVDDSLNMNREFVVSPGQVRSIPDSVQRTPSQSSSIDESFF